MAWAKENCRGTEYSSLKQWLLPLSTYISPYIGVLMLSPLGDVTCHEYFGWKMLQPVNAVLNRLRKPVQEYGSILSDPASATFGALHEIWSDARTLGKLTSEHPENVPLLRQRAPLITALAGDIQFTQDTRWSSEVIQALSISEEDLSAKTFVHSKNNQDKSANMLQGHDDISPAHQKWPTPQSKLLPYDATTISEKIDSAINIVIVARKGFVSGILIPVVLMLNVTASTFYDAYSQTGDKDTALDLAYCVWYSWFLIVGVAGNCYASALSPTVAQRAFDKVLEFGTEPRGTALRHRYVNNHLWGKMGR